MRALRRANLVLNTLLLLATAEFVFFPYFDSASDVVFTRVGALYPDSAKIVVRYPSTNATENLVRIVWRQADDKTESDAPWREGPVANLSAEHDWVQTVRLQGLWPTTQYECESITFLNPTPTDSGYDRQTGSKTSTAQCFPTLPLRFASIPPRIPVCTAALITASLLHLA